MKLIRHSQPEFQSHLQTKEWNNAKKVFLNENFQLKYALLLGMRYRDRPINAKQIFIREDVSHGIFSRRMNTSEYNL